jgi:hypothetical protein
MHTTVIPEDVSVTPAAVLDGWQFTPLQDSLPAPVFSITRTPAPGQPDSGELAPELTNARLQEYVARRELDELLERGALTALFC